MRDGVEWLFYFVLHSRVYSSYHRFIDWLLDPLLDLQ